MKLKIIPYEKKTVREFVLCQVHGFVRGLKQEIERAHLDIERLEKENQR